MLFRGNNEKIPETIPSSTAWHLWKRKLWVWSGMANDALKICGTHFNPSLLVQCVMPKVCFAIVQAESGWLYVLVSRQYHAPIVHSPHFTTQINKSLCSQNIKQKCPSDKAIVTYGHLPSYSNSKGSTDWLRQACILGIVPVRYMNDRYQSRVLRFSTKRVVCPTCLLQWISVNGFFFMVNAKISH